MSELRDVVRLLDIRAEPISLDECYDAVCDRSAGGVAVFSGVVRDDDHGRPVVSLEYSAHPSSVAVLRDVADRVASRHPVTAVAALHRVGLLSVGDIAVVVAASAAHRDAAFAAARDLIDDLKTAVPIWKRQEYADGTAAWVGCETG